MKAVKDGEPMWTSQTSHITIKALDDKLRPIGWFVALTGGVLRHGASKHDLDLVLIPLDRTKIQNTSYLDVWDVLLDLGWEQTHSAWEMQLHWRSKGLTDSKFVESWKTPNDRRVDLIYYDLKTYMSGSLPTHVTIGKEE